MIRHVVLLKWKENTPQLAIREIDNAFAALPALIPQIRQYQHGPDLGLYPGNADYLLVADFDSEEDFKSYVTDKKHREVMKKFSLPFLESFQSAQFEI